MIRGGKIAVHASDAAQVEHRRPDLDRFLERGDRPVPFVVGDVRGGENPQKAGQRRRRDRFQAAADRHRQLGQLQRIFGVRHVGERGLRPDALGQHHAVVHSLEMGARVGQERGCLVGLADTQVGLGEEVANAPQAER